MTIGDCCAKGFEWEGTPSGKESKLANNISYTAGDNKDLAILYIHDLFGWTYKNNRLLVDHYAREANATVYMPDFFGGEVKPSDVIEAGNLDKLDMPTFLMNNSKDIRGPEIFACAKALRAEYKKVIACGFCYGGWASFQLGAKGQNLVDAISVGHPSLLTREEIDAIDVPVQVLAVQHDHTLTPELRTYVFNKLLELNVPFALEHFPNVQHGCLSRGDGKDRADGAALERGKNVMVAWFNQWGH